MEIIHEDGLSFDEMLVCEDKLTIFALLIYCCVVYSLRLGFKALLQVLEATIASVSFFFNLPQIYITLFIQIVALSTVCKFDLIT